MTEHIEPINKHVIVTGGARGLGRTIALHLRDQGCRVAIIDRDRDALNQIRGEAPDLFVFQADLAEDEQVRKVINDIAQTLPSIDVLVNNAGMIHSEPLLNLLNPAKRRHDYQSWKKVFAANLDTTFLTTSYVVEQMALKRTKGVIINISSVCAAGNAGQSAYSAAKAGINALTLTWSKELGSLGIRCVAIAPGFFETHATHDALAPALIDQWRKQTALKRLGSPEQIAKTVQFIIANDYLTGTVIAVNGGLTL